MNREAIRRRACGRCEYCHAPEAVSAASYHIEHIIPRSRSGTGDAGNTAYACVSCNLAKSTHVTGMDSKTRREVRLFHPRRDVWADHFEWSPDGRTLIGRTPAGRATVERLKLNSPRRKLARAFWRQAGIRLD